MTRRVLGAFLAAASAALAACGPGSTGTGQDRAVWVPDHAEALDIASPDPADTLAPDEATAGEEPAGEDEGVAAPDETGPADPGEDPDDAQPPEDETTADEGPLDSGPDVPPVGMIKVTPPIVDFGYILAGSQAALPFRVMNVGGGALSVTKYTIKGPSTMSLVTGFQGKPLGGGVTEYKVSPAKVLKPGASIDAQVKFIPLSGDPAEAEIRVFSSDALYPQGFPIFAAGNTKTPCLKFVPDKVEYGIVVLGEPVEKIVRLESCGEVPVKVTDVSVDAAGKAGGVTLNFEWFPNALAPTEQVPLFIGGSDSYELKVKFNPAKLSVIGPDGKPIQQKFRISAKVDTFAGLQAADVTATVVDKACVKVKAGCGDGLKVAVGTLLHLNSTGTTSWFGDIAKYEWTVVQQPENNNGWLMPSPSAANPAFLAGAPGDYVFGLKAWDVAGNPSCAEAIVAINATQLQRATFELTWQSVGPIVDPKPPCMGQDVDLHFVHPNATGILMDYYGTCPLPGYFDLWWDCFWYNKSPSWGIAPDPNVQDETRMIADAQQAPGPEIVDQGLVCQKNSYKVGVHLFDDCGYGPVIAKMRIYVVGTMVHEQSVQLEPLDLWEVGRFNCETGMFVPTPGGPTVTKGCLNPNFQTPK